MNEKLDTIPIALVLPLMISLLDLLIGNELLTKIFPINESNKQEIIVNIIIITLVLLTALIAINIIKSLSSDDYNLVIYLLIIPIVFFITIGFVWDIVTSIYGFFELFTIEESESSIQRVAAILAIVMTSFSFFITLLLPNFSFKKPISFVGDSIYNLSDELIKKHSSLRLIYFVLFGLAILFDFLTSFSGNAELLGFENIKQISLMQFILLAIGTCFVCLCQYIFWIYFEGKQFTKSIN